jgi:hypothetical protein
MVPSRATETRFKNWSAVLLENAFTSMTILPEIGGKVVSIQSRTNGHEFLWQDDTRPYVQPRYSDAFGNYDISGFDECFPTIGECPYPDFPWQGISIPDHGELWCIPWQYDLTAQSVYLHTYGVRFPYHFEKWITLAEDTGCYTLTYRITNLSPFDLNYLWSAHPLFAAEEGMRIVLPSQPDMRFIFAAGNRVAGEALQKYRWPWLSSPSGDPVDYSMIGSPALCANDKVVTDAPAEGWCALYQPHTRDFVALRFAAEEIPYLGICINHASWPFEGVAGYWVALEPCTGYPDRLDQAIAQHAYKTLSAHSSTQWTLGLQVGQAATADAISSHIV